MVWPPPEGGVGGTSGSPVSLVLPAFHAFPRVVVDLEGLLRRAFPFGHVPQVEPDPGPRRASTSHRVHQNVRGSEVRPCLGMPLLPPLQPLPGGPARLPGAGGGTTPWRSGFPLALRRFEGWTRGGSPACLAKCGGHGASPNPAASCWAASSSNACSEPVASSIPSAGSP